MRAAHKMTKRQILTDYLNAVYFGEGAYGVEAAAQRFFDLRRGCARFTRKVARRTDAPRCRVARRPDREPVGLRPVRASGPLEATARSRARSDGRAWIRRPGGGRCGGGRTLADDGSADGSRAAELGRRRSAAAPARRSPSRRHAPSGDARQCWAVACRSSRRSTPSRRRARSTRSTASCPTSPRSLLPSFRSIPNTGYVRSRRVGRRLRPAPVRPDDAPAGTSARLDVQGDHARGGARSGLLAGRHGRRDVTVHGIGARAPRLEHGERRAGRRHPHTPSGHDAAR